MPLLAPVTLQVVAAVGPITVLMPEALPVNVSGPPAPVTVTVFVPVPVVKVVPLPGWEPVIVKALLSLPTVTFSWLTQIGVVLKLISAGANPVTPVAAMTTAGWWALSDPSLTLTVKKLGTLLRL